MGSRDDSDEAAVLVAFLGTFLQDHARGKVLPLEVYQRRFAGFEDAVATEYERLSAAASVAPGSSATELAAPGSTERSSRPNAEGYDIEAEVAHGGMGRVYRVFDRSLQRHVAMKVLRQRFTRDREEAPQLVARFFNEAQITAQLDHPGIVAVHEVGMDDTRPYFTMSLVRGRDLKEIVTLARAGEDGWNTTRVLGVLVKVCEAVAFAHSKGVVHRDLKPANIMVGQFGETYVMDWGLARVSGAAASDRPVDSARSADDSGSPVLTAEGDVVGTPAYMSPEQARGEIGTIDTRSDVYALGSILYHVLTGHTPYAMSGSATTSDEVLRRLVAGPPPPIHELEPRAPGELAAICEKAMARNPDDRYPDASALGDDLRAFTENRVVSAFETGALAELRKWVSRNRAFAAAGAVAILALVAGLVVSAVLKREADRNAARANALKLEADASADAATRGFVAALDAVESMLTRVGSKVLSGVPRAERVRRDLLADAKALYDRLLSQHGDDPALRLRFANANDVLGRLQSELGDYAEAERHLRAAIDDYVQLAPEQGDTADLIYRRESARLSLAHAVYYRGEVERARPIYADILAAVDAALERFPDDQDLHGLGANAQHTIGRLTFDLGDRDHGIAMMQRSLERLDSAPGRNASRQRRRGFANSCNMLGQALITVQRTDEAEPVFERAIEEYEDLIESDPNDPDAREGLANVLMNIEWVYRARKDNDAQLEANARCIELFAELAGDFPNIADYHAGAGAAINNRGLMRQIAGELEPALADFEEAIRRQRRALAIEPTRPMFLRHWRHHNINRLWTLRLLRRYQSMLEHTEDLLTYDREKPKPWCDAGAFTWMAAVLASVDPSLDEAARLDRRDELVGLGLELLRTALDKGLADKQWFAGSEFDEIRELPSVVEFSADLDRAIQKNSGTIR